MKLSDRCAHNFDSQVRARGDEYVRLEKIDSTGRGPTHEEFTVRGSQNYFVEIRWGKLTVDQISVRCTCPFFTNGNLCKHIWASLNIWGNFPPESFLSSSVPIQITASNGDSVEKIKMRLPTPKFKNRTLTLSTAGVEDFHPFTIWKNATSEKVYSQIQRSLSDGLVLAVTATRALTADAFLPPFHFNLAVEGTDTPVIEYLTARYDKNELSITCPCHLAELGICHHLINGMVILQLALTRADVEFGYADWALRSRVERLRLRVDKAKAPFKAKTDLKILDLVIDPRSEKNGFEVSQDVFVSQFSVKPLVPHVPNFYVTPAAFSDDHLEKVSQDPLAHFLHQFRFRFSDKTELSFYELLFHPYLELLPQFLLNRAATCFLKADTVPFEPQTLRVFAELFGLVDLRVRPLKDSERINAIYHLYEAILKFQNESDPHISLWLGGDRVLPLNGISCDSPSRPTLELIVKDSTLILTTLEAQNSAHTFLRPGFSYDENVRVLQWNPVGDSIKTLGYEISNLLHVSWYRVLQPLILSGPEKITRVMKYLNQNRPARVYDFTLNAETILVPEKLCRFEVHVNSGGAFMPALKIINAANEELCLIYFSPGLRQVLKGLHGGIADFFGTRSTDLALHEQGDRRKNDLKVLKHRGAFLLLYVQASLKTHSEAAENEKLAAFVDRLYKEVMELVFDGPGTDLELCSRKIKMFIKQVIGVLDSEIFSESIMFAQTDRLYQIDQYGNIMNKALLALVQAALMKKSPTDIFRARGNIFEAEAFNAFIYHELSLIDHATAGKDALLLFERFEPSDWFDALPQLQLAGVNLFVNGQPIQGMDPADLRSEFSVDGKATTISSGRVDWFALHPKVFFRGKEIAWEKIRHGRSVTVLEHEGRGYVVPQDQLPTLLHLHSFWEQLIEAQRGRRKSPAAGTGERVQLKRHQILELLVLRLRGVNVQGGPGWDNIWKAFENLGQARDALKIKPALLKILKPYQGEGIQWLVDLEKLKMGAVLADDMGLGKTLQTLAFLEHLNATHLHHVGRYLVIVPTSLAYNWISESEKFTPGLPVQFLHPTKFEGNLDPGLYVTTYGLMAEHAVYFQSHKWNVVIFDEAQNLKSFTTTRYKAAVEIPGDFKIALTGTPLENHLGELFAIIDLVLPGALGNYVEFKKHFLTGTVVATEEVQRLRMIIKPILLRRTKDKILRELPPKTESIHLIPFESQQRKIYRDIAVSWNERILSASNQKSDESLQLQMLTALMRLRQACSDPAAIPGVSYKKVPPKIEHLIQQILEVIAEGHSVLVFTQFLQTLARVEDLLKQSSVKTFVLTGSVSADKRKLALSEFEKFNGGAVLLMTLKTGGVGLNLTKASYVFHIEPWWNPAVENQATDRAHRLGQTRPVQVYRYIMKDSLEEKIQELKAVKKSRFDMIFSEDIESIRATEAQTSHLSRADFEYLLK